MNRTTPLRQALALTLAAGSGLAAAQSNVMLAGVVDAALRHTSTAAGSANSLASGSNSTSRLQFTGTEDLGGGMYSGFWLEGTLSLDTGGTGTGLQFDRRSTVHLGSRNWGEFRLGREWTPVFYGFVFADPFIAVGVGSSANFLSTVAATTYSRAFGLGSANTTLSRSSNSIQYWLPPGLGGFYGQVMNSWGENANAANAFRYRAARLGWRNASVDVAAYGGSTRIDATGQDIRQAGLFGAYRFDGGMRLSASVTESRYLSSEHVHWVLGLSVPVRQFVVKASYNLLNQSGTNAAGASIAGNDATMAALGLEHHLSKRTALYGNAARLDNKGAAAFVVPGAAVVVPGGSGSTGYEVGLRHNF
jgi:predicted porin